MKQIAEQEQLVKAAREALRLFNILLAENKKPPHLRTAWVEDDLMMWIGSCMGELKKSLPKQPSDHCENMHCGDSSRCWDCDGCKNYRANQPSEGE